MAHLPWIQTARPGCLCCLRRAVIFDGGVVSVSDLDESDQLDEHGPPRGPPYDVFLSYNTADRGVVRNVARRLREAGVTVWFDKESLPPGAVLERELAARLGQPGLRGLPRSQRHRRLGAHEMEVALDRVSQTTTSASSPCSFPASATSTRRCCRRSWRRGSGSTSATAPSPRPPSRTSSTRSGRRAACRPSSTTDGECPYRGLDVFEEEHARYFFGRGRRCSGWSRPAAGPVPSRSSASRASEVVAGARRSAAAAPGGCPARSERWRVLLMRPGPLTGDHARRQDPRAAARGSMQRAVDGYGTDERTLDRAADAGAGRRAQGTSCSSSSTSSKRSSRCATTRPSVGVPREPALRGDVPAWPGGRRGHHARRFLPPAGAVPGVRPARRSRTRCSCGRLNERRAA